MRPENKKHCHPKPKAKNDNAILLTRTELQLGTLVGPLQLGYLLLLFPQGKGDVNAVNEIRQNQYMEQNLHQVIGNGLAQQKPGHKATIYHKHHKRRHRNRRMLVPKQKADQVQDQKRAACHDQGSHFLVIAEPYQLIGQQR